MGGRFLEKRISVSLMEEVAADCADERRFKKSNFHHGDTEARRKTGSQGENSTLDFRLIFVLYLP
jgi:hypothetical protein